MSTHDQKQPSRRRFFELLVGSAAVASGWLPVPSSAANLPHLSMEDPAAKALGYHDDTTKVPASKYPAHNASQECGKCRYYKGAAGAQWGPCMIFPGKDVHVHGWCSAFAAKG